MLKRVRRCTFFFLAQRSEALAQIRMRQQTDFARKELLTGLV